MSGITVQAPDGTTWTVRRRWIPLLGAESPVGRLRRRMRQTRRGLAEIGDVDPGCLEVFGEGVLVGIVGIVVVVVAVLFVIPLLVAVVDLLVLLLLGLLATVARVVFRGAWTVEARSDRDNLLRWGVVGWRASGQRAAEVAEQLRTGQLDSTASNP